VSPLFKRRPAEPVGPVERPEVRQYRYLLRTVDLSTLEALHRDALGSLDLLIRAHILRTAQDRLLSGRELTVDDIPGIAHLVAAGELQTPGIIVSALTEAALERLANRVISRPDAVPLLEGHDAWDGQDVDVRQVVSRASLRAAQQATRAALPDPSPEPARHSADFRIA
jgi:hypothetical protein